MTIQTNQPNKCIIVSNRGPIEYNFTSDKHYKPSLGAGGVITGLLGATDGEELLWISLAKTDADRAIAKKHPIISSHILSSTPINLSFIDIPKEVYDMHYDDICNRLFWFTQHYLYPSLHDEAPGAGFAKAWNEGYVAVNRTVAEAVKQKLSEQGPSTPVLFQDYHLYLAPEIVRAAVPDALLSHISYIPWPDIRYLSMFPNYMIQALYRGTAANNIIGFQTSNDIRNFLGGVKQTLDGVEIFWDERADNATFLWHDRYVHVKMYPIALSSTYIHSIADSSEASGIFQSLSQEFSIHANRSLILREDRIEPTKNILRGFQAYEKLLEDYPDMQEQVIFLALLVPSRQNVPEYRLYEKNIRECIDRINGRFGNINWQPIIAIFGNDRVRGLACLKQYDVLLVNPLIDGMNLVAKEGGLINQRDGVIILSRTAGAHDQLGEFVMSISPLDVDDITNALYVSLSMEAKERSHRASAIRQILQREDGKSWFRRQLHDLSHC